MTQNIKNQCTFLYKFDIKFACLNLYGIIFHEQQVCVCVFKHMWWRPILTCPLRHKWLKMQNHTQTTAGHGMSHSLFDTIFLNKVFLVDIFINISFFSIFRTIAANTTREAFNGEIRQRTGNTWRQEQWSLLFQDILNDLLQQELHYIITEQRTLISKRNFCGNFYFRYNHWMHNKR